MKLKKIIFLLLILFTSCVSQWLHAEVIKPFPDFHIAGNLYYVGNQYSASYLIATSKGNILMKRP